VATADDIYTDPSALRSLYVHDLRSRPFSAWRFRIRGGLLITPFGRAELVNSIALASFRRDITPRAADSALQNLLQDIEEGRLHLAELPWRQTLGRCVELSRVQTPLVGTRTLDILHVASAEALGCRRFVTYDERQSKLARAIGLRVVAPS
jgi:predicted nucleic acid-binding protein